MQILISIKPDFVNKILSGEKIYEFRTKVAKNSIDGMYIYSCYPIKRVVAYAEIVDILKMPPADLWEVTKDKSGISKSEFESYFKGKKWHMLINWEKSQRLRTLL